MMFEPSSPERSLWHELTCLKNQLHEIAHQPITASTESRDQLLRLTINFIRDNKFDAIHGGLYRRSNDRWEFDSYLNALVAEYLLTADRVFYHGEMTYLAKAILSLLTAQYFDADLGRYLSKRSFTHHQAPFTVDGKTLLEKLDEDERQLLSALVDQKIDAVKSVDICYRYSLKEAADKAGIHFKLAQVIDAQISAKLRQMTAHETAPLSTDEFDVRANCQILRALVTAVVWNNAEEYTASTKSLARSLGGYLRNSPDFNDADFNDQMADICLALIEYLQVDFDASLLNEIASRIESVTESEMDNLSDKARKQAGLVTSILRAFIKSELLPANLDAQPFQKEMTITIYQDAGDACAEQMKQSLFAQYDRGFRIYRVDKRT